MSEGTIYSDKSEGKSRFGLGLGADIKFCFDIQGEVAFRLCMLVWYLGNMGLLRFKTSKLWMILKPLDNSKRK